MCGESRLPVVYSTKVLCLSAVGRQPAAQLEVLPRQDVNVKRQLVEGTASV